MNIVALPSGGSTTRHDTPLIRQAKEVLDFNWTGRYTRPGPGRYARPSPSLYPHQWSWDSAFIAIGYAHYAQERAMQELRHLFESQWENGLLPQIVYDPHFGTYFPGVDFWCAGGNSHYPCDRKTSGVVQPPVHATAVLRIYQHAEDLASARDFLEYAYPHLKAWHEYLYGERDPEGEGLVYLRHPWESGMDNSPLWDGIMQRLRLRPGKIPSYRRADTQSVAAQDRPDRSAYDRFAWLVRLFAEHEYDEAEIRKESPFLVQDVLFNAVLYQAERDLSEIARLLGKDASVFEERADEAGRAIDQKLWNEKRGTYLDFDLVANRHIYVDVASNFVPLFAGIPDKDRADRMVDGLEDYGFGLGAKDYVVPVPSYDRYGFGFSPVQYWRGPVWINIDWFLMRGLKRYGFDEHAERLRETIVGLCQEEGFHEYFDPLTGAGHGSELFSWTAALLIDVSLEAWDFAPSAL